MLEQYKLVGTMNIFGLIPDFVYPIFESKGKYFFQNSDNCLNIDSFDEIYGENNINRINLLDTTNNRLIKISPNGLSTLASSLNIIPTIAPIIIANNNIKVDL